MTKSRHETYSSQREGADGPLVVDAEGRRRRGVEPLAVEEVLATLPDDDIMRALASGTKVGHLHLQGADLKASYRFYRDGIGLIPGTYAPWSG